LLPITCTSIGESRTGELLRQHSAQLLDEGRGRPMVFPQADERIAVFRTDRAGILVRHVDAGKRQADIVDDIVELIRRDGAAHGAFDQIEQARGLLDAGAGLGAHVHQDLAGIDIGKEILAEERPKAEGQYHAGQESDDEGFRPAERQQQQRSIAVTDASKAGLKALLKTFERIARAASSR
jgi:hypothetical protein